MLFIRLLIVFLLGIAVIFLGCYLLFNEQKYKAYFIQSLKITLYLAVIFGIAIFINQLF